MSEREERGEVVARWPRQPPHLSYPTHSPLLYRSPSLWADGDGTPPPASTTVADQLAASVAALAAAPAPASPPALAAALARGLCIASRACPPADDGEGGGAAPPGTTPARPAARPRLLILAAAASDAAADAYVPVMNAAFAAHKLGVAVDVCALGGGRARGGGGPLAAVAHITGGLTHAPASRDALLMHLTSVFAPSASTRALLAHPRSGGVDLRASCFCHAAPVDVGHVCSVCLSIFCGPVAGCATCGADFGAGMGGVGGKRAAAGDA